MDGQRRVCARAGAQLPPGAGSTHSRTEPWHTPGPAGILGARGQHHHTNPTGTPGEWACQQGCGHPMPPLASSSRAWLMSPGDHRPGCWGPRTSLLSWIQAMSLPCAGCPLTLPTGREREDTLPLATRAGGACRLGRNAVPVVMG